jgi:hypothetical protein
MAKNTAKAAPAAPEPIVPPTPGVPVLDMTQPMGEIYGSGEPDGQPSARYVQHGHYFGANRAYLRSDPGAKLIGALAEVEAISAPADLQIEEAEVPELLTDPRADQLLLMPLDQLAEMVAEAGGPSFSGDNAIKYNVAWLLKFTA